MSATAAPARPAGPRSFIPFQELLRFRRAGPEYLQGLTRDYGDIVFFRLGQQDVYFVNDPDVIKDILVTSQNKFSKSRMLQRAKVLLGEGLLTSEGTHHLRQRRLAQPAFHRDRLRGYGESMVEFAVRTRDRWESGATLNIATEMMQLTLAVVAKTLFNADVDSDAGDIGESLGAVLELFNTVLLPFSEYLEKLPLPFVKRFEKARNTLDSIIYRIIKERRSQPGSDQGDLLSMLLNAQDEDGTGGMSDTQVRDEALTLFLAGHETTAVALTWTLYLLSQNPQVEARLMAELDNVLAGNLPTVDDLPKLKYVEQVFAEGMRLYPPAWAIGRMAIEPYATPGPHSWEVEPGNIFLMSPYVMHRDARFFPEPERFDPDRWLPEQADKRPKFSYFPFGGGTRVCIGERFAWMEGVLLLSVLLQRWKFTLDPTQVVEKRALLTLRPKHGMRMRVERR